MSGKATGKAYRLGLFSTWLHEALIERKMQQRDLAFLLNTSEQNICRYAKGAVCPSLNMINRILKVFDCHLEIVPDGDDDA